MANLTIESLVEPSTGTRIDRGDIGCRDSRLPSAGDPIEILLRFGPKLSRPVVSAPRQDVLLAIN